MPLLPVAVYGLTVPNGDVLVPAAADFPATFRITMAAIDPSEPADLEDTPNGTTRPRATLKILREEIEGDDEDEDDEFLHALNGGSDSEEDESESDGEAGPSDPAKSKKARKAAALAQLLEAIKNEEPSDEDMEDAEINGAKAKKGKAKASDEESEEDDSEDGDDEDSEDIDLEELVLCTLDPEKHYQQPLDITIGENERVFFKVTGTHTVFLTGNYVVPDDDGHNHHHEVYDSDEDEDYDLSPDEDELDLELEGEESDDLDDLEDPRVTEVDSDEEEAPKLVAASEKKGKNKRTADESSLDDLIAKSAKTAETEAEPKLSKKQLKKLKKNNGEAAPAKTEESKKDETPVKTDKKVQFAKNLEQGPTGSAEKAKAKAEPPKAATGVKTVQGVKIDDKKIGTGPACKKGARVGMRYIGKLVDGKVFDSNKSGKPFSFKLGAGEVIKGWDIGIAGMAVGGERRLTIPAHLAYGSKGQPGIPANSTLVFDVKMLEIK